MSELFLTPLCTVASKGLRVKAWGLISMWAHGLIEVAKGSQLLLSAFPYFHGLSTVATFDKGAALAHNHHIPSVGWFDRAAEGLDLLGTASTQGHEDHLVHVEINDLIEP